MEEMYSKRSNKKKRKFEENPLDIETEISKMEKNPLQIDREKPKKEVNPFHDIKTPKIIESKPSTNKRGRPTFQKIIKFSTQPRSIISQILSRIKEGERTLVNNVNNVDVADSPMPIPSPEIVKKSKRRNRSSQKETKPLKKPKKEPIEKPPCKPKREKGPPRDKSVVCEVCSHRSSCMSQHRKHLVVHQPKRFSCDYPGCTHMCRLASNLLKHKRVHTNEKPYLCDQCSFRSNFINSLKVHKRIHTMEKPYECKHCSYKSNSSSNLKKHCRHRHPGAPI